MSTLFDRLRAALEHAPKYLAALLLAALALIVTAPPAAAYQFTAPPGMWTCPGAVGWQISGDATPYERVLIADAVMRLAIATGQRYRFDGVTDWLPQVGNIDTAPDDLVISMTPRWQSSLLQVDGRNDEGYTQWTPTHAGIAIEDSTPNYQLLLITMHELMLSRHLTEAPDPGGLLDHISYYVAGGYNSADTQMLRSTGCQGA